MTENGKAVVVFKPPNGPGTPIKIPCGQCIGCRLDRSRDWALRCMHEASLHDHNSFLTLTYNEENLPPGGTLVKAHHQQFMRDLRKFLAKQTKELSEKLNVQLTTPVVRYFLCGEYGEDLQRPHYHALLFGYDFLDKIPWCKSGGNQVYRSPELESIWTKGHSWIGEVTWQSAAYVARYVLKKVNGEKAWERYCRDIDPETGECTYLEPEYIAMSRGGNRKGSCGIAADWYRKYKADCRKDFLTVEGVRHRIPRYYDKLTDIEDPHHLAEKKRLRKERANANEVTSKRLAGMEKHKKQVTKRLKRSI